MPSRNRVDPHGQLHAVPSKAGMLMGNRGVLGNPDRRPWQHTRWISCSPTYATERFAEPPPVAYTKLFFLDDATALAAGHRPCWQCRRDDYRLFLHAWDAAHGARRDGVEALDAELHAQRTGPRPTLGRGELEALPVGAMVLAGDRALARHERGWLPWSFEGYGEPVRPFATSEPATLLTPPGVVRALAAGYRPDFHPSAR